MTESGRRGRERRSWAERVDDVLNDTSETVGVVVSVTGEEPTGGAARVSFAVRYTDGDGNDHTVTQQGHFAASARPSVGDPAVVRFADGSGVPGDDISVTLRR